MEEEEEAWISPRYCKMNVPGFRSLAAKSPDCPLAGWVGVAIGVIFTTEEGPVGMFAGMEMASPGFVRSDNLASGESVGEYAGAVRYGSPEGQFLGSAERAMALRQEIMRAGKLHGHLTSGIDA